MKWDETIASRCRYGEQAGAIFGEADIIWEDSEDDYSGSADVLALLPDGRFCHYEWSYGSCSSCDDWEADGLTDEEVVDVMRRDAVYFGHVAELVVYAEGRRDQAMAETLDDWLKGRRQ